jgi:hypothetical protein
MTKRLTPIITLMEYEQIFRVIHGMLLSEEADISRSCLFFGIVGAAILQEHHGLKAIPQAGNSIYHFGKQCGLVLGNAADGDSDSGVANQGFHCWIQVDEWYFDLTAPLFQEMTGGASWPQLRERKMFQKPLAAMCTSRIPNSVGEFIAKPNPRLTKELVDGFFSTPAYVDLVNICVDWYRRPPKKMIAELGISNLHGVVKPVTLSPLRLTGVW